MSHSENDEPTLMLFHVTHFYLLAAFLEASKYQILWIVSQFDTCLYKKIQDTMTCLDLPRDSGRSAWLPDIYSYLASFCDAYNDLNSDQLHYENDLAFDPLLINCLMRTRRIE